MFGTESGSFAVPLSIMINVYFIAVFGGPALLSAGVEYLRRQVGLVPVQNKSHSTAGNGTPDFFHRNLHADQRNYHWPYDMSALTVARGRERRHEKEYPRCHE